MIRIVGVSGSPRRGGNTEHLLQEALTAAADDPDVEITLLSLINKNIQPCDGCRSCRTTQRCHIDDDVPPIFEILVKADGIILATPVYFGSATPQIKALIDRVGYLSISFGRPFENKVGAPLVVARRAGQNFTFAQLLYFFYYTGMIIPGTTYWPIAFGQAKGEVTSDTEGMQTARNLGIKIVDIIKKLAKSGSNELE